MTIRITGFGSTLWQMALMALQYLRGRKLRTTLTTLAIVFGVALIFAFNIMLPGAMDAFQRSMTGVSGAADLSVSSVTGESFAPDQPLKIAAGVANVKAVTGSLRRQITLPTANLGAIGKAPQIELVGVDPATAQNVRNYVISDGRFLEPGDTGKAVIPAGIAEFAPQLKVGATFPLITAGGLKLYTIVGLLGEKGSMVAPQITITLSDAQAAFDQPGLINTIDVAIVPGADRDAVAADMQRALGSGFQLNTVTSQIDAVGGALQIGYAMFSLLGMLALFLGAFLIFNTFRTVIVERRHDLAMLRAIGATRRQMTQMILVESLVQGLLGTLVGMVLGYLMTAGLTSVFSKVITQFMPGITDIHPMLNVPAVVGAILVGMLTTLLAGYWPARAAGRISPLEALRPERASDTRRAARWGLIAGVVVMALAALMLVASDRTAPAGALMFLVGMVLASPGLVIPVANLFSPVLSIWFAREGDLARGNLIRQPGRAAITASTLMIGLASIILMAAAANSFGHLITNLINRNFSSDLMLMPQTLAVYGNVVGADESLSSRLRALPEVATASGLRYATGTSNGETLEVLGIDPVNYPEIAPLDFAKGNPDEAYAALSTGRGAIINTLTSAMLKLDVGSEFVMQTSEGPQTYHVVGIGNDLLSFKLNAVFISQANMEADFHKTEDVMLMINLKPDADKAAALAEVKKIMADYPQFTVVVTGEYRTQILNLVTAALSMIYALALVILFPAVLGLLNTLTINVMERTREIGVVRAVGGSRVQVRRIVTGEALLLGLFGAATGVLAGVAMSYGFISAFGVVGWKMTYEFPAVAIVATIIVGILLALFSSLLPARSAAKLDIIRALHYE